MIDVTLEPEKRVVEFEVRQCLLSFDTAADSLWVVKDTERVHTFVEDVVKTFLRDQGFLSAAPPSTQLSPINSAPAPAPTVSRTSASRPSIESPSKKQRTLSQLMLPTSRPQSPSPAASSRGLQVDLREPNLPRRIVDKTNVPLAYPLVRLSLAPSLQELTSLRSLAILHNF